MSEPEFSVENIGPEYAKQLISIAQQEGWADRLEYVVDCIEYFPSGFWGALSPEKDLIGKKVEK